MSSYEQVAWCLRNMIYAFTIEYHSMKSLTNFSHFSHRNSQKIEPFDKRYQYLLFAAEPYEIIAFKVIIHPRSRFSVHAY